MRLVWLVWSFAAMACVVPTTTFRAADDDAAPTCDPNAPFGAAVEVFPGDDRSMQRVTISADGLELWTTTHATGSPRSIYVATRTSRTSAWSSPALRPDLVISTDEDDFTVSADLLTVVVHGPTGLLQLTRASPADSFSGPTPLVGLAGAIDPYLIADGLVLYFAIPGTEYRVSRASRASITDDFGPAVDVGVGAGPWISDDELSLYVSSFEPTTGWDIATTTRTSPSDSFGLVAPIATLNSFEQDWMGAMTRDGCELYFTSDRSEQFRIYRSTR